MRFQSTLQILTIALLVSDIGCSDYQVADPTAILSEVIVDAEASFVDATSEVVLTWTAPLDPENGGSVSRYEIRYLYDQPFDWSLAFPVIDPPTPARPGTRQTYVLDDTQEGRELSVAVAGIDEAGTPRVGNTVVMTVPGLTVAGCLADAVTGEPVPEIEVIVQHRIRTSTQPTGADGCFQIENIPPGPVDFVFRSTDAVHRYFEVTGSMLLLTDVTLGYGMIPFRQSTVVPTMTMLTLLKAAVGYGGSSVVSKWPALPVPVCAPELVNSSGVDYAALTTEAVVRWNEAAGAPIMAVVDTIPDRGVVMNYHPKAEMEPQVGFTVHSNDDAGKPLRDDINLINDFINSDVAYRVILHELGHTIRFGHLPSSGFIMYGAQPLPTDISDDEEWLLKVYEALPDGTNLEFYWDSPTEVR